MLTKEWTDGFSHDVEDSNGSGPISGSLGLLLAFPICSKKYCILGVIGGDLAHLKGVEFWREVDPGW